MSPKNLWGDIAPADDTRAPTAILREQAAELSRLTQGVLDGAVTVKPVGGEFVVEFSIIAPVLNGYEYTVMYVEHPVVMYPLKVMQGWDRYNRDTTLKCENEVEFEAAVGTILKSEHVRAVVASLITQSRSA